MNDAWFKLMPVGYGNVPSNWKGWAIAIAFTSFVIAVVILVETALVSKTLAVVIVLAVTAVYVPFIKAMTSGEWRWRTRADRD